MYGRALEIARRVADPARIATTLGQLALVFLELGDYDTHQRLNEEAMGGHVAAGNKIQQGIALNNLAAGRFMRGQLDEARALLLESIAVHREIGNKNSEAIALGNLSEVCYRQGELEQAMELNEKACSINREVGDSQTLGTFRLFSVEALRMIGDLAQAERRLDEAEELLGPAKDRNNLAVCLAARGLLELAHGRSAAGFLERTRQEARALGVQAGSVLGTKLAVLERAQAAFEAGRPLYRGMSVEDVPEGPRRWLSKRGGLAAGLDGSPGEERERPRAIRADPRPEKKPRKQRTPSASKGKPRKKRG
jgi:tetratricopeptide (TPR) repeat protein